MSELSFWTDIILGEASAPPLKILMKNKYKIEDKLVDKLNVKELATARNAVAIEHAERSRGRFLRNYASAIGMGGLATGSLITGALWTFWDGAYTSGVVVAGNTYLPGLWSGLSASGQAIVAIFMIFTFLLGLGFIAWILVNKHEQINEDLEVAMDEVEDDLVMVHLHNEIKHLKEAMEEAKTVKTL